MYPPNCVDLDHPPGREVLQRRMVWSCLPAWAQTLWEHDDGGGDDGRDDDGGSHDDDDLHENDDS